MTASPLSKVSPSTRTTAVSLSPSKSRRQVAAFNPPRPTKKKNQQELSSQKCEVAMSRAETVFVSAAGDVLVCRSRNSPYATALDDSSSMNGNNVKKESNATWWNSSEGSLCGLCLPCDDEHSEHENGGGLLGGAAQVANDIVEAEGESKIDDEDIYPKALSLPLQDMHLELPSDADEESLLPLPSFDYTGFLEGESDTEANSDSQRKLLSSPSLPTVDENGSKHDNNETLNCVGKGHRQREVTHPQVMHGVPTFLPAFSQIRITKVSAHPLGSHVLLISSEALLFSYGLNDHGQLGLGRKTSMTDKSQGFVTQPTVVTPFLENGGKAVVCAAGVNHSLVVVKTEARRVGRLRRQVRTLSGNIATSSPSSIDANSDTGDAASDDSANSIWHHQLYGFGGNDSQKLGLVNAEESAKAEVLLPRRVALHCKVWPRCNDGADESKTEPGIFAVAASSHHSAALVRQPAGAVELYTWGNASDGALGHDKLAASSKRAITSVVPVPTIVSLASIESSDIDDRPVSLAVGPTSTFLLTATGQCFSFGTSEDGLLGQGHRVTRSDEPKIVSFPLLGGRGRTQIKSISIGARHAIAVASDGSTYCWGTASEGRVGMSSDRTGRISPPTNHARGGARDSVEQPFIWKPLAIDVSIPKRLHDLRKATRRRVLSDSQLGDTNAPRYGEDVPPRAEETRQDRVMSACAGYDSTVFVMDNGTMLSCGKGSARLGQGERYTDSLQPSRVFGGLHLWK